MTAQQNNSGTSAPFDPQNYKLPALRAFQVIRLNPLAGMPVEGEKDTVEPPFTAELVICHLIQYTGKGTVLLFLDLIVDRNQGPIQKLTRMINGYYDVREVAVPVEQPNSRIIV